MAHAVRQGVRLEPAHVGLIAVLLALALFAWLVTGDRMEGMDAGPGTDPGTLGFYVGSWIVMMAAMMFPSVAPTVRIYSRVQRRRRAHEGSLRTTAAIALFVAGYLVTWTMFGLAAFALFEAVSELNVSWLSWDEGGPYVAGALILAAAAYELTPAKDACLRKCRSPLDFLMERWHDGLGGAMVLGMEHGAWCVGCCWGLMAVLFALGVMSVGWMIFVAVLIAVEKLAPWSRAPKVAIAVLLAVLGIAVALVPDSVPGLTIPDDGGRSGPAMEMEMGMG
jgi:predicted metal-binding membrane protein